MDVRHETRRLLRYLGFVAVLAVIGLFVLQPSIDLPIAAWAIVFYPVLAFLWWFVRTPYKFHAPEPPERSESVRPEARSPAISAATTSAPAQGERLAGTSPRLPPDDGAGGSPDGPASAASGEPITRGTVHCVASGAVRARHVGQDQPASPSPVARGQTSVPDIDALTNENDPQGRSSSSPREDGSGHRARCTGKYHAPRHLAPVALGEPQQNQARAGIPARGEPPDLEDVGSAGLEIDSTTARRAGVIV